MKILCITPLCLMNCLARSANVFLEKANKEAKIERGRKRVNNVDNNYKEAKIERGCKRVNNVDSYSKKQDQSS